jgi:hypothetical protein
MLDTVIPELQGEPSWATRDAAVAPTHGAGADEPLACIAPTAFHPSTALNADPLASKLLT